MGACGQQVRQEWFVREGQKVGSVSEQAFLFCFILFIFVLLVLYFFSLYIV